MRKTTLAFICGIISLHPQTTFAFQSARLTGGAPTCEKWDIYRIDQSKRAKLSAAETKIIDYKAARICDERWLDKKGTPTWLGEEPRHSKNKNSECKMLERQYNQISKSKYTKNKIMSDDDLEKAARILEKAVDTNCFFY